MNSIMQDYYPTFEQYQAARNQLMDLLNGDDLGFHLEQNPTLGELCKEMGETQYCYLQSFKTLKLTFDYSNEETGLSTNINKLKSWFAEMDADLKSTLEALSQDSIDSQRIDRGSWEVPVQVNLTIYTEALLIFYGKVWVYLNAMGKKKPQQWVEWIG